MTALVRITSELHCTKGGFFTMRRIALVIAASLALAFGLGPPGTASASAKVGDELLYNPGLEAGTGDAPAFWTSNTWANTDPSPNVIRFTWAPDGHAGNRSARVDVDAYTDGGDSKWVPDPVTVSGGHYYTFSDWYKSDVNTAVSVYYETADDVDSDGDGLINGHWSNLFSGIAPASTWTQYTTGFTMPAGAIRAQFVHFIAAQGYLQTDDYSVKEAATPPGFSKPMISLTFDDGSQAIYDDALPLLTQHGFKTTQYIPTAGLSPHTDEFLMTPDEVRAMARDGHEIGSHSVTHPELPAVSPDQLKAELKNSKSLLETITGEQDSVSDFAYPFGLYDARVIGALEDEGYRSGRSVEEGYNSRLDVEPYDIRVQNMTSATTPAQFKAWVDYAQDHNYWLVIVYHEVVPDGTPACPSGATEDDPDNCQGDYDTTVPSFDAQLNTIETAGLSENVMTVRAALDAIDAEMHSPIAGAVEISPRQPTTNATVTATTKGFSDPDGDALKFEYQWRVNGKAVAGATSETFDLAVPGHGNDGDKITVDVYARDPDNHASTGVSDSVTVARTPSATPRPTPTPAPSTPTTPAPNTAPSAIPAPTVVIDKLAPRITVKSPKARTYKVGKKLTISFTCTDSSGVATWKATLRRPGAKARTVKKGAKVRLSRTGKYILRITAKDRKGNTASKTITFRVVRK